jgi:holliday junction DNA helicase RuvA
MSPISRLRGRLEEQGPGWAVVDVGGIGLQVFHPLGSLDDVSTGSAVDFYTHLYVREDQLTLYGFLSRQARELFIMLIGISGIGPKGALAVLSTFSPDELAGAIAGGDVERLRRVPGLGVKTAGRLILDMQERIKGLGVAPDLGMGGGRQDDVAAALVALGYSTAEANSAARATADAGVAIEERIKRALQHLSAQ